MATASDLDGVLVTWGDRLFYPGNRMKKDGPVPRLGAGPRPGEGLRLRAAEIRQRIAATVRRVPQVVVKVTGGGRGMRAIAAHLRYIGRNGRLVFEDERGETVVGKEELSDLMDEWRLGGSWIQEEGGPGQRREAFNIMLSMPRGTDSQAVLRAARAFAQEELAGHKLVMVLHDQQANPHVHLSVRAESTQGRRLNPRKSDLHRWRETFARELRRLGVEAEATRQATRGRSRNYEPLWRVKAREDGRLRTPWTDTKNSGRTSATRAEAVEAWLQLGQALASSGSSADRELARSIARFVVELPSTELSKVTNRAAPRFTRVQQSQAGPER